MTTEDKKWRNKNPEETRMLQDFEVKNAEKSEKVWRMENLIHNFDAQKLLDLNERLRTFYKKVGDEEALDLLDRMTIVMDELSEIINQVKAKRISLEQWQREIEEKLQEINQVLQMMEDWETTGI